jgi:chromatin structure-remodeling complex protein RSC7
VLSANTVNSSTFNSYLSSVRRANNARGVYDVHTNSMLYPSHMQPTHVRFEQVVDSEEGPEDGPASSVFPHLKPIVSRNFLVTDIHLQTPPAGISASAYNIPFRTSVKDRSASARANFLAPFQGLESVPDEIKQLLPESCKKAFDQAVQEETSWFSNWGDESSSTCRREPVVDKAIVPYSMAL